MAKTLATIRQQVKELVGDYQGTTFTDAAVAEAINWAQNLIIREKGFKRASVVYSLGSYPTGDLPTDLLVIKRVLLIQTPPPA